MRTDRLEIQEDEILMVVRTPVRRFLKRLLAEPALAEDAESETLLTLMQRLRAGLRIRRPISFALQVAWSKAVEVQRRAARDHHIPAAPRPARPNDPARMAELKDWLESGLAGLEPVERALLHLRYVEDLSYRELARVLDEPIGTIGRRLHEARLSLKRHLEKSGSKEVPESSLAVLLPMLRSLDGIVLPPKETMLPRWAGSAARFTTAQKLFLGLGVLLVVGTGTWALLRPETPLSSARVGRDDVAVATPPLVAEATNDTAPPRQASPRTLSITGRVIDEAGRGVAGASVHWLPSTGTHVAWSPGSALPADAGHVAAGVDGGFQIQPLPDQTLVALLATAPGFAATLRDDVRVGVADVMLQLGPGLAFGGVIRNLEGDPVGDAIVTYHARVGDHPVKVTTRSARDGRYSFEHLPIDASLTRTDAGVIEVAADRHATQVKAIGMAVPGDAASRLELDVWLARGTVLEGTVRDASGAPVEGAHVEVWMNSALETPTRPGFPVPAPDPVEARRIKETKTDASGRYRFDHMPVRIGGIEPSSRFGPLLRKDKSVLAGGLVVSAPGRAPAGLVIPLASVDETTVTVDVEMHPEIVLTGSVRDASGAPIGGVEVEVRLETDDLAEWVSATDRIRGREALASTTTGDLGEWVLGGLPRVGPSGRLAIAASSTGHASLLRALPGVRESTRVPDLVLGAARPIRGIVVDEHGTAVPGAIVRIVGGGTAATATGRDGRFEMANAAAPAGLELRIDALGLAQSRVAVPEDAANEGLRIAMVRERVVRGTVRSAEGRPVAGALVTAVPATLPRSALTHDHLESHRSLAIAETTSDAAGAFALGGLPQGPVWLWAGVPWPRNDGLLGLLLGRKFAVVVPEPETQGPVVVTLPAYRTERGRLSVRVVEATSKAPIMHDLAGSLLAADEMIGGSGMFAGPGLLVFDAVPSGTYRLIVKAAGYPRATTAEVKIGDPASPSEIRLELTRGARLAGRVILDGPIPPGGIFLRGIADSKDVGPLRVRCGDDGKFDVDGLAPGTWRMSAEAQDEGRLAVMTTRPENVVLELGKTAPPLELRLLPIQRVRLRLTGLFAEGDPPTIDKKSHRYGDLLRRLGEFRLRCRDETDVPWIDTPLDGLPFEIAERDVIVHLPLPSGAYRVAIDHGDDEIDSRRISSPGTAEINVPD